MKIEKFHRRFSKTLVHSNDDIRTRNLANHSTRKKIAINRISSIENSGRTNRTDGKVSKTYINTIDRSSLFSDVSFSLNRLPEYEYFPIRVRGRFDHSREILLAPRTRLDEGAANNQQGMRPPMGAHVITPFRVSNQKYFHFQLSILKKQKNVFCSVLIFSSIVASFQTNCEIRRLESPDKFENDRCLFFRSYNVDGFCSKIEDEHEIIGLLRTTDTVRKTQTANAFFQRKI